MTPYPASQAVPWSQRVTPLTQEFLKLHKDAYKAALEAPDEASQAIVQVMDQVYYAAVN